MASTKIVWNEANLARLVKAPQVREEVGNAAGRIAMNAYNMGASFRTGLYHPDHKSPAIGNTQPSYLSDVRDMTHTPVGIAYTANYAAMKDNYLHNTLLKAVR